MRQSRQFAWIIAGLALSLLLPVCGSIISTVFFPDYRFAHLPIHSLVEAAGGLMAVAIAAILLAEQPRKQDSDHFVWMANALIGMGVLDLYHAAVYEGNNFVWLHSTATFVGGLLFACVWMPPRYSRLRLGRWLPWGTLAAAMAFGLYSCFTSRIPPMASAEGEFTVLARGLNIGGGIGFLAAGVFFVRRFIRGGEDTDWLFAIHTTLFGAAGILFEMSVLWDVAWWWWHVLRLVAYLAALTFAVRAYLDAERSLFSVNQELSQLNERLDRTVEERTADLRASEERYALAVRGSTDGLWDWDVGTNDVYYSPRFKELLGYQEHEFENVFLSFESRLHPDDRQRTLDAIQEHLDDRIPYDVEYRLKTKSAEYRWFRARGQALWDEIGNPTRMAGSITDVTAEKEAESSLQHERFLFHTLMEHLPDAIYFKDAAGRFMRVAEALVRRLGVNDAEEVIGKTDADFFPAEYADQARADEERLMRTGQPLIGKEEHPHWLDDEETWVSTTKVPLRDENGEIIGTFGISHDITAQKLAEQRFRKVIEAAPNAMIVVNGEGKIQFVNEAAERMFGYSREELDQASVEMLVPAQHRSAHANHRQIYLQHPVARAMGPRGELTGLRKDGSEFPVEIGLSPISIGGKTVVLSSIFDLTMRKQAERALIDAKEAAESANRAKSDFLANMSHEIRTPMNAVIGMTELVLETQLTAAQKDYLTIVQESAESLLTIINEILDFSKIEAGRLELESIDFDLHEDIGDTLKSLGHRAHAKDLELAWQIDSDVPRFLNGDPGRLRQILVNLIGNAIKFTSEGEVVLQVDCKAIEDSRATLHFTVRDTGVGIPKEKQEEVFAAFTQADSSTTRQFGGTGLGLAITTRLVDAMHGKTWVESELGQGSCFHFLAEFGVGKTLEKIADREVDLRSVAVLVVDDNETNRLILKEMLSHRGIRVLTAESGKCALQVLEDRFARGETRPLLLSDVNMPEMDGYMLAQELRSRPHLKDTTIIFLTSGVRPGDADRCRELNISLRLMKPVKQSELFKALSAATGHDVDTTESDIRQQPMTSLPQLRILLAEDGKANQLLAKGLLSKFGHQVVVVENGEQAITRCQQEPFDLILMDVQMPVMDGLIATQRIREWERDKNQRIPIVAMTARAMKGDRERCLEAGMDDYVSKPIRQHELHEALGKLFVTSDEAADQATSDAHPPTDSLIDWNQASESVEGDTEMLRDIAGVAQEELPELIQLLHKSLAANDLSGAERAAHTIKSTLRILGAAHAIDTAAEAEEAARGQDIDRLEKASARLKMLVSKVVCELDAFLYQSDRV